MTSSSTVPASALALLVGEPPPAVEDHVLRRAWPFPQDPDGRFAGEVPAGPAVDQLEDLRRRGATHLVLPATANGWLAERPHLSNVLNGLYRVVAQDGACRVFDLRLSSINALLDSLLPPGEPVIAILHPRSGLDLAGRRVHRLDAADPEKIEGLRAEGLRYLIVPDLSPWAPEDGGIMDVMERRYRKLVVRPGLCAVFDLAHEEHQRGVLARLFRDG